MNKRLISVLMILMVFFIATSALAYQLKDYGWGRSFEAVQAQLADDNKRAKSIPDESKLIFEDRMYGADCEAIFGFTPATKLLYMTEIHWVDITMADKVKAMLVKKYGEPHKIAKFDGTLEWDDTKTDSSMFFTKDGTLICHNTKYLTMFNSEMQEKIRLKRLMDATIKKQHKKTVRPKMKKNP